MNDYLYCLGRVDGHNALKIVYVYISLRGNVQALLLFLRIYQAALERAERKLRAARI